MMWQYLLTQKHKMLRLAEKMGFVGGQQINHPLPLHLAARAGHHVKILAKRIDFQLTQASPQPANQQRLLVIGQMNAALLIQQATKTLKIGSRNRVQRHTAAPSRRGPVP